jgi:hypothetical protein
MKERKYDKIDTQIIENFDSHSDTQDTTINKGKNRTKNIANKRTMAKEKLKQ